MNGFLAPHRISLLAIAILIATCDLYLWPAVAQSAASAADLAQRKLELEIARLEQETGVFSHPAVLPLVIAAVGLLGNWYLFRLNQKAEDARAATEDESKKLTVLTEPRLKAYSTAFALLRPTALFFPPAGRPKIKGHADPDGSTPVLTRENCREMGRGLSDWYFGEGGVLMTESSRDAYFALMKALGRAADAQDELISHSIVTHGSALAPEVIKEFQAVLKLKPGAAIAADTIESWAFGVTVPDKDGAPEAAMARAAKDYVMIQALASRLRTKLAQDIKSRRPPDVSENSPA